MPSREDSLEALVSLVRDWLDKKPSNKVFLQLAAKYGHEYLLYGLCKELNAKCHVSKTKYATYSRVKSLSTFTTDSIVGARIHACSLWEPEPEMPDPEIQILSSTSTQIENVQRKHVVSSCPECPRSAVNVMTVKPSMMWFSNKKLKDVIAYKESERYYRLLYSFHSSLREVRAMFEFLRPLQAHPCAIPQGSSAESVMALFSDLLPTSSSHCSSHYSGGESPRQKRVLTQLRLDDIQPVGRDAYLAQFDASLSSDDNASPPSKRIKWTGDDSFVLKGGLKQKDDEEISMADVPTKPLPFDDDEPLELKLNASSSTPRSDKTDQSSRLNGATDFDRSLAVAEEKGNCHEWKQPSFNASASYNGSEDMWGEESDEVALLKDKLDMTHPQPSIDLSPTALLSADDSVAVVEPPPPPVIECITLSDSPVVDDDDDVCFIADVSPPRPSSIASAASPTTSVASTGWLCAKKRLL
uniref:Protein artemis n=1 Tax=Plectus sambesii TaxID=2011161 RepID=A0A914X7E5_9BILA